MTSAPALTEHVQCDCHRSIINMCLIGGIRLQAVVPNLSDTCKEFSLVPSLMRRHITSFWSCKYDTAIRAVEGTMSLSAEIIILQ